jgi:rhodanese-related sulfurtransferase
MSILKKFAFFFALVSTFSFSDQQGPKYQCMPCGYDCDKEIHDKPGKCAHCQMDLVPVGSIKFKTIQPVLLDVRTKEEFEGRADPNFGTLKNAVNIPILDLEANLGSLAKLKNRDIIVFCSHSHRSPRASYLLSQNGFKQVTNMAGGMSVMPPGPCVQMK